MIPLPYRLLLIAGLVAAAGLCGWVKGAGHVQAEWDKDRAAVEVVVVKQQARTARIEAAQKTTTENVSHETDSALARSDEYWRVRYPLRPGRLPDVPGTAAATDAGAAPAPSDPAGDSPGTCNPADGSADAIVILEWQRWYRGVSAATALP